ncbi:MAG: ATP-binding protein [Gammaproteobacteria bacterium]|nr:ATP-binding protein [Gammaproteobacteria bacterium]MBT8111763.1 ATP-binding protein [Gammaproteobacteria bacterium]NND47161.1 ATP-binding protein [Woeseiaceae bacterium]NNL46462.1 ATP-binding protein [Woeseiaceae bacterium]
MNNLANIARSATPGDGVQFQKQPYGPKAVESFLRDVLAMANASVDGPRYIVIGAEFDSRGRKRVHAVSEKDFSGKPAYEALANDYIEPPLRLHYKPVSVNGKQIGVFEIGDCSDRPYMMRIDYSETLRRGDAYMRLNDTAIKMGRRQLQSLFEKKFQDSMPAQNIEVGFAGEISHKTLTLPSCDLSQLPSALAASKLEQLVKIQMDTKDSGSTTVMARLVHARLYGSDDPYVSRTPDELMQEMEQIRHKYRNHDRHFLFENNGQQVQIVVCNRGEEPIVDASIALVLPKDDDLYIADRLPRMLQDGKYVDRSATEMASYPSVSLHKKSIHVTKKIGDIPVEKPTEAFASALRICVGPGLIGRRFGIRYALHGQNLRSPATGTLRVNFRNRAG